MYPQQPSDDPNQGGRYPGGPSSGGQYPGDQSHSGQYPGAPAPGEQYPSAGQYAPGPEQYGGHPTYTPGAYGAYGSYGAHRDKMPPPAIVVRVLMFIGGACGLLFGGMMWLAAGLAASGGQAGEEMRRAMEQAGVPMSGAEAGVFLGLVGAIPFVYGVISLLLASLMGRRSTAVLWSVVIFQGLAALLLVLNIVTGAFGSIVPLIFAVVLIVPMLGESTRAYYSRPSAESPAH